MSVYRETSGVQSKLEPSAQTRLPVCDLFSGHDWIKADRIFLYDRDGQRFQDCFSSEGTANLGYIAELTDHVLLEKPSDIQVSSLCEALTALVPSALSHVCLRQSADEALAMALVLARKYFIAKGFQDKTFFLELEFTRRTTMRTAGAAKNLKDNAFDVRSVYLPPISYGSEGCCNEESATEWSRQAIASLKRFITLNGADRCAAIIIEPVQIMGDLEVIPPVFLTQVHSECSRLGVLLIVNERLSSFGRIGGAFFCSVEGVLPDILVVGKGLSAGYHEIGAALFADHLGEALDQIEDRQDSIENSKALGDLSIATTALTLYGEEGLDESARDMAAYFKLRLLELLPMPYIGNIRVQGWLATIAIVENKIRNVKFPQRVKVGEKISANALKQGLIFKVVEGDVLAFAPSFNYTKADIDRLVEGVRNSIAATFFSG